MKTITTRVVGVSYGDDYPEHILNLRKARFPVEASLIREPDNQHDRNAIAVLCAGQIIGHLRASLAEKLAPKLDQGEKWRVVEADVLIHPEHEDRPGIEIRLEKVID